MTFLKTCKLSALIVALLAMAPAQAVVYSKTDQCGGSFGLCDPAVVGKDTCCSAYGWCGSTAAYCAPSKNCQSGCWPSDAGPGASSSSSVTTTTTKAATTTTTTTKAATTTTTTTKAATTTTTTTTTSPSGVFSKTDQCGASLGMCNPAVVGTDTCCSKYGWCGSTAAHCAPSQGCQSGCWPSDAGPGPSSSVSSSPTTTVAPGTTATSTSKTTTVSTSKTTTTTTAAGTVAFDEENPWYDAKGMFSSCNVKGTVAFTYDDGPTSMTPDLLASLATNNVKATFFVIGEYLQDASMAANLKQAYDAGHDIGSHTWTHPSLIALTNAQVTSELTKTSDAIQSIIGHRPHFMRPPYGDIDSRVLGIITGMGMNAILWNADTLDWSTLSSDQSYSTLTGFFNTYKGREANKSWIVLQHDIVDATVHGQTPIIALARSYGYRTVTMSECRGEAAYLS